jgi:murein DD-endopeptidase MepM/ murein hydrolase activator NlpD
MIEGSQVCAFFTRLPRRWTVAAGRSLSVVVVACLVVVSPVLADPAQDKRQVDKELAQAEAALESATGRAKEAGRSFVEANRQLPGAKDRVAQTQGDVIAAQVKVGEAQRAADAAQQRLERVQADFGRAQARVESARKRLGEYARSSYESGYFTAPAMVLAAQGVDQILAASEYAQAVAATRRVEVQRMKAALNQAAEQRADVADRKRKAEAADQRARGSLANARGVESAARDAEQQVTRLTDQRAEALKVADSEREASGRQYEDLQAESRRIEAALQEAARQAREDARRPGQGAPPPPAAGGSGGGKGNGGFIMPVKGYISSNFGYRFDPYYKRSQLHAGTDFAAPGGTPIKAVAAGRVVRAGWASGYGKYTCIYHWEISGGRGLSTCSAHQSSINVSVGQRVKQGQVIGRVGTTGASTGFHLHFEVRIDGRPVNPMAGWL